MASYIIIRNKIKNSKGFVIRRRFDINKIDDLYNYINLMIQLQVTKVNEKYIYDNTLNHNLSDFKFWFPKLDFSVGKINKPHIHVKINNVIVDVGQLKCKFYNHPIFLYQDDETQYLAYKDEIVKWMYEHPDHLHVYEK